MRGRLVSRGLWVSGVGGAFHIGDVVPRTWDLGPWGFWHRAIPWVIPAVCGWSVSAWDRTLLLWSDLAFTLLSAQEGLRNLLFEAETFKFTAREASTCSGTPCFYGGSCNIRWTRGGCSHRLSVVMGVNGPTGYLASSRSSNLSTTCVSKSRPAACLNETHTE